MPSASRASADPVKRRPKDRKVQIARAATDAFSELGYHAVSMENIAARVGISAAALYRHSQGKYDLFREVFLALGQQLVDATAFADDLPADADPGETLSALTTALIDTTIVNRTAGGLYRWEGRYLRGDDQRKLAEQIKVINRRLQRPLIKLRPKLTSRQRWILSAATLSVIGSITDHRSRLGNAEIRATLSDIAAAVLKAELPTQRGRGAEPARAPTLTSAAGSYELLLHESMRLFNERGYRETGMEDIAAAVGIPVASIYQYFPGKAAILAVYYRRAADQLSADLSSILATSSDPEQALARLIEAYVTRSFANPELACVYYTERHNLPETDAVLLYNIQRSTVESWARLAVAARPELTLGRARYAVHAAFALAVDIGRLVYPNTGVPASTTVRRLMEVTVLGRPAAAARDGRRGAGRQRR
ncbi:TetR family transcriptional regulator [Mycobacterium avium subsp. hominissuis]|nr:TetR family transcriptional regulator [Mycobacterium avium]PBJ40224.1 TetR family transcriptional regulator [Mycobacterium avium subsp. hominissuis]PBA48289.1 TetR family transcriptional regulator [Mycobacterium avium]PBA49716.1 TetR family transcriptional regulator [Mycobacterium avium]PBA68397.1 TetR family transcriptional regulator [Mycobacterium avium]